MDTNSQSVRQEGGDVDVYLGRIGDGSCSCSFMVVCKHLRQKPSAWMSFFPLLSGSAVLSRSVWPHQSNRFGVNSPLNGPDPEPLLGRTKPVLTHCQTLQPFLEAGRHPLS